MYYIWELTDKFTLRFDVPTGQAFTFYDAKTAARIAATMGSRHRMVTKGKGPNAEILRIYRKKTGEKIYPKPNKNAH